MNVERGKVRLCGREMEKSGPVQHSVGTGIGNRGNLGRGHGCIAPRCPLAHLLNYIGPVEVIEVRRPQCVQIQVGRRHWYVHPSRLKPYFPPYEGNSSPPSDNWVCDVSDGDGRTFTEVAPLRDSVPPSAGSQGLTPHGTAGECRPQADRDGWYNRHPLLPLLRLRPRGDRARWTSCSSPPESLGDTCQALTRDRQQGPVQDVSEPLTADVNCDPDRADPAAKEPSALPSLTLPPGMPATEEQEAVSVASPASRTRSEMLRFR
uniref:Uncharacterized protein LOC116950844 n=1 Tax=Petromyzon marinus TaxID=7757 RepID=A0AAJ7TWG8_PETMA|nr:uncharacterized protein LOC116950844 [Petromyzon marinus]